MIAMIDEGQMFILTYPPYMGKNSKSWRNIVFGLLHTKLDSESVIDCKPPPKYMMVIWILDLDRNPNHPQNVMDWPETHLW